MLTLFCSLFPPNFKLERRIVCWSFPEEATKEWASTLSVTEAFIGPQLLERAMFLKNRAAELVQHAAIAFPPDDPRQQLAQQLAEAAQAATEAAEKILAQINELAKLAKMPSRHNSQ